MEERGKFFCIQEPTLELVMEGEGHSGWNTEANQDSFGKHVGRSVNPPPLF